MITRSARTEGPNSQLPSSQTVGSPHAIEKGLVSVSRIKVLRALAKAGSEGLTKYAVEMDSGVSYYDVLKALKALVEIGWVERLPTEPVRYRLNLDDEAMIGLIEFFRKAGYI